MKMSDGLNQARALRVAEIIADFRNIQGYINGVRMNPSAEEYNEDGYVQLRQCLADAQALLAQPFQPLSGTISDGEQQKAQLRRIITDAALRRFKAQKIYMRATAALRWVNARAAILQGRRPEARDAQRLDMIRRTLTQELNSITDQRIYQQLSMTDQSAGKWTAEDPSLQTLQGLASNSR